MNKLDRDENGRLTEQGRIERLELETQALGLIVVVLAIALVRKTR